jgi:hypothetical protein
MYNKLLDNMRNVCDIERELAETCKAIRKDPTRLSLLIRKHLLETELEEALIDVAA